MAEMSPLRRRMIEDMTVRNLWLAANPERFRGRAWRGLGRPWSRSSSPRSARRRVSWAQGHRAAAGARGTTNAVAARASLAVAPAIGLTVLAILLLAVGIWCALALWFRLETGHLGRDVAGAAMLAVAAVAAVCLATRSRWRVLLLYAGLVLLVLVWWLSLRPSNDRPWAPDVARAATGTVDGDRLVVDNVRNFAWRSPTDFDQRWERRSYDLSKLSGVDLVMSHWAGEEIAHTILSFGFTDGPRLAFSIEIRKEQSEAFSTIAGFFKQYEIAMVAADERDVVRVRSSIRGEDVRIYRLRVTPASARKLLEVYIAEANEIAQRPRFYNTLTTNCTTLAFQLVQAVHPTLPLDPRILVSGYLPNYAYDIGAVNTAIPFSELRERAKIHGSAPASGDDPSFSARIREGVPPAYGG